MLSNLSPLYNTHSVSNPESFEYVPAMVWPNREAGENVLLEIFTLGYINLDIS